MASWSQSQPNASGANEAKGITPGLSLFLGWEVDIAAFIAQMQEKRAC